MTNTLTLSLPNRFARCGTKADARALLGTDRPALCIIVPETEAAAVMAADYVTGGLKSDGTISGTVFPIARDGNGNPVAYGSKQSGERLTVAVDGTDDRPAVAIVLGIPETARRREGNGGNGNRGTVTRWTPDGTTAPAVATTAPATAPTVPQPQPQPQPQTTAPSDPVLTALAEVLGAVQSLASRVDAVESATAPAPKVPTNRGRASQAVAK